MFYFYFNQSANIRFFNRKRIIKNPAVQKDRRMKFAILLFVIQMFSE